MRSLCTATIAVVVMALLAGCGGGGTKTVTVTTGAGASTASATATATGSTTGSTPTATTTPTAPAATTATAPPTTATPTPTAIVHLTAFRSPSGNIGCELTSGIARCDIAHRDWSPPPKPSNCQLDYGQGLIVYGSSRGELVCAGDTALDPTAPVLHYGTGSEVSGVECVSATSGMTCTNTHTGHGFWIAIQGYRTF